MFTFPYLDANFCLSEDDQGGEGALRALVSRRNGVPGTGGMGDREEGPPDHRLRTGID